MTRFRSSSGQTLVEIAIAMTILSLVLLSAAAVAASASRNGTDSYLNYLGTVYVQEGMEQMRMYRDVICPSRCDNVPKGMQTWGGVEYINTGGVDDPNQWVLTPTSVGGAATQMSTNDDPTGKFQRYIQLTQGCVAYLSDATGSTCPIISVNVDVHVLWKDQSGTTHDSNESTVLTDWKSTE